VEPPIVIIGAGAAGIGAARRLAAAGLTPLLLEALPRPGGRAWTVQAAANPLDLGCGYLHSGDRNPWTQIAEQSGFAIERNNPAWDRQSLRLGADAAAWQEAGEAFERWSERLLSNPPPSDIAADALEPENPYNAYLQAMSGYISGDELERISARDYSTYDQASTDCNWRLPAGYGTLIAASLPASADLRLNTPLQAITLDSKTLALHTASGTLHPRAAIITVSTNILAGNSIAWPAALDPWREAAANLPLGNDEKLFFEITGESPFAPETHVLGDLYNPATGSFYLRPFGRQVIECFLGGAGARALAREGQAAAFAQALDQLANHFGANIRQTLRPLIASNWTNTASIAGAYSHALPGQAASRAILAQPHDNRLFFAGEATHPTDFSTAHGAYLTGQRAAEEALAALQLSKQFFF
jgi:monoamine oxidase